MKGVGDYIDLFENSRLFFFFNLFPLMAKKDCPGLYAMPFKGLRLDFNSATCTFVGLM